LWTPRVGKYKDPAAVMLWFYGGDFKEGGESFGLYNGSYIASSSNTIVVATNYRIGAFGFLYTAVTDANVGIEDQRFTLKWITNNIAKFGGDPGKVTIFGESAGGASVFIHLATPKAPTRGVFHRAILESGPLSLNFKFPETATILGEVFGFELGCTPHDLTCFQSKSTRDVLSAGDEAIVIPLSIGEAVMKFAPVITGLDNLPVQPFKAFESGNIVNASIMGGSNLDDGVLFGYAISPEYMPFFEYIAIVAGIFHDDEVLQILKMYPPVFGGDNRDVCSQLINDYVFLCPMRRLLNYAERAGVKGTYLYQFAHQPPFCPWPKSQQFCCNKVCHGDEIPYVYVDSGPPFPWTFNQTDLSLAQSMAGYWSSFAMSGDPNKYDPKFNWPVYRAASDQSINLEWPLSVKTNLNKDKCDQWDKIGYDYVRIANNLK